MTLFAKNGENGLHFSAPLSLAPTQEEIPPGPKAHRKCPLCGDHQRKIFSVKKGLELAQCLSCLMIYDPVQVNKNHLLALYNNLNYFIKEKGKGRDYGSCGYVDYESSQVSHSFTAQKKLQKFINLRGDQRSLSSLKVLDVGAAMGDFVFEAGKLGMQSEGVELSPVAVAKAQERGVDLTLGDFIDETFFRVEHSFDALFMQDVLGHFVRPQYALTKAHRLLKAEGFLYIKTPNRDGFLHRLLKSFWFHYKAGEHLNYYTPQTLKLALEKAGFEVVELCVAKSYFTLSGLVQRLAFYLPSPLWGFFPKRRLGSSGPWIIAAFAGNTEVWARPKNKDSKK